MTSDFFHPVLAFKISLLGIFIFHLFELLLIIMYEYVSIYDR